MSRTYLPPGYEEKIQSFLEVKEARNQRELNSQRERLLKRHDDILQGFREHSERFQQWDADTIKRHKDDCALFKSRRDHEHELEAQRAEREAARLEQYKKSVAANAEHGIATLEANIRRLGLDEEKPQAPNSQGAPPPKEPTAVELSAANAQKVADIRNRKEIDIAARRDKLQRQYVSAQQQLVASQDVLQRQGVEAAVARAHGLLEADRKASLAAQRKALEKDVEMQLAAVYLRGEESRRKAAFVDSDSAFAIVAAAQRAQDTSAFSRIREEKKVEEEVAKDKKRSERVDFFHSFVEVLSDIAVELALRNVVTLGDGTALRRVNPPSAAEWRDTVNNRLAVDSVERHLDNKRAAIARANSMASFSPKSKRSSSVNFGALTAKSLTLMTPPQTAGEKSNTSNAGSAPNSPLIAANGGVQQPFDADFDTEEADTAIEAVITRDSAVFESGINSVAKAAHKSALKRLATAHNAALDEVLQAGLKKTPGCATWWTTCLEELPPAAVFVHGDLVSGVHLLADARYNGNDASLILTPDIVTTRSAAQVAPPAPLSVELTLAASGKSASIPSPPAGKPSAKVATPLVPVRPTSAKKSVVSLSNVQLAQQTAKLIAAHHRKQLEALVRKEPTGYPKSLLLVHFPLTDDAFVAELHAHLSREAEEEEKNNWSPLKLLQGLEPHNTPRGGGGTHRSSIAGTNPNTPHLREGGPPNVSSPTASHHDSVQHQPKHHSPPIFTAAAGKQHANNLANQAATMFFPPVRIGTIFLRMSNLTFLERYQTVLRQSTTGNASSAMFHAVWSPPPEGYSQTLTASSLWHGVAPLPFLDSVTAKQQEFLTLCEEWSNAAGEVNEGTPLPYTPANASPISGLSSIVGTATVPVPPANATTSCSSRLTRVLHFTDSVVIDNNELSPQDPREVLSQILSHKVRSVSERASKKDSNLARPLKSPLSLMCWALNDAALNELLDAAEMTAVVQSMCTMSDVLSFIRATESSRSFMVGGIDTVDDGAEDRPAELMESPRGPVADATVDESFLSRLSDLKEQRKVSYRALREMDIESSRSLHLCSCFILHVLMKDAFSVMPSQYAEHLKRQGLAGDASTVLDQMYWKLCDVESVRVQSILGTAVGALSCVLRNIQTLQLKVAMELCANAVEEIVHKFRAAWLTVARRNRFGSADKDSVNRDAREWESEIAASAMANYSLDFVASFVPSQEMLSTKISEVHESGASLLDAVQQMWQQLATNLCSAAQVALARVVSLTLESAPLTAEEQQRRPLILAMHPLLEEEMIAGCRRALLASSSEGLGQKPSCALAFMQRDEAVRKKLSTCSRQWLSNLFQQASQMRKACVALAQGSDSLPQGSDSLPLLRPSTFEELLNPLDNATAVAERHLLLSSTEMRHILLSLTLTNKSSGSGVSNAIVDRDCFVYGILLAQLGGMHLHVPSCMEELLAPVQALITPTVMQTAMTQEHLRTLFLPSWWTPSPQFLLSHECGGPRGNFFSQQTIGEMFDKAAAPSKGSSSPGGAARLDAVLWLTNVVTGQVELSHLKDIRDAASPFHFVNESRSAVPNVIQTRRFVLSFDALLANSSAQTSSSFLKLWNGLHWWSMCQNAAVSSALLSQLRECLASSLQLDGNTLAMRQGVKALETMSRGSGDTLSSRLLRWVLTSVTSSGQSAVLEYCFAIASSISASVGEVQPVMYKAQPLTIPHTKVYVPVEVATSILALANGEWTPEDLSIFLLMQRQPSANNGHDGSNSPVFVAPPSPMQAPVTDGAELSAGRRLEEVNFAALTASHWGTMLIRKRMSNTGIALPLSDAIFLPGH